MIRMVVILTLCVSSPLLAQSHQPSVYELLKAAHAAQDRRDFRTAAERYLEAARIEQNPELLEKSGLAYYLAGSYSEAATVLARVVQRNPRRWAGQLFLGMSLFKMNRFGEALLHFNRAAQINSEKGGVHYWLGCTYQALGQYEPAIDQLRAALTEGPRSADILYALAETYLDYSAVLANRLPWWNPPASVQRAFDQRIARATSRTPRDVITWLSVRNNLEALANPYLGALKIPHPSPGAIYALSRIYGKLGQITAERLWLVAPNSYRSHELLGEAYENQKNYSKALIEYDKALRINPKAPGLHYDLGQTYWEMKQFDKAVPNLERELALNPYHASANYVLGNIYLHIEPEHPERAAAYLQKAVEANSNFPEARKEWGRALSLMNENQKAIEQLDLAAKENPSDASVHYFLAAVYRRMGLEDKVRRELEIFNRIRMSASAHEHDENPKISGTNF